MMKLKKGKRVAFVLLSVVFAVGIFAVARYFADNRLPCFSERYVLYVYPDTDVETVIDSLERGAGALRRGSLVRCAAKEKLAGRMKPGKYAIEPSFSAVYAVRMLLFGWQSPQNLTLSGTLRSKAKIASVVSRQMMADSASVHAALCDTAFLSSYGFTPENVFAMILLDTYQMYWTASVQEIFDRFKKEYESFWNEDRKRAAAEQGLSPMEVSVLASIVSGETLKADEYPRIAGVYLNRLRMGMRLQADPTIAYCHDYTLDRILKKHLSVDSPYNTYRYKGLPPSPINVPPKACIEAVLHPESHDYVYFCASPDFNGRHRFAVTYREHLKNAREFQRALTFRSPQIRK